MQFSEGPKIHIASAGLALDVGISGKNVTRLGEESTVFCSKVFIFMRPQTNGPEHFVFRSARANESRSFQLLNG
jgi:hypothetical protein